MNCNMNHFLQCTLILNSVQWLPVCLCVGDVSGLDILQGVICWGSACGGECAAKEFVAERWL